MSEVITLSDYEVFGGVYDLFKAIGYEVKFSRMVHSPVAHDFDDATGYFGYDSAVIVKIGKHTWAITRGKKSGGYPADKYGAALKAVRLFDTETGKAEALPEIESAVERDTYFRSVLIFSVYDGRLSGARRSLSSSVVEKLLPVYTGFVAATPAYDIEFLALDGRRIVKTYTAYKPELVPFLYEISVEVLKRAD
jgi:hypothetical protein